MMLRTSHQNLNISISAPFKHDFPLKLLHIRTKLTGNPRSTSQRSLRTLPDLKDNDDLFNFTRGRFVVDEAFEMAQRHVRFDVTELGRIAAEAVRANICVNIEKYSDGMYNKAMLLTMNNGAQVVAKVPNPNSGKSHFTTASEVATMDFVRNTLKTPVPKVFAWSSKAHENPVGAEYIIMEKLPGIELEHAWPTMKTEDRLAVVKAIANYQKSWTSISFKKYGGLCYAKDLDTSSENEQLYTDADGVAVRDSKFAIGPSNSRELIDNGRATVEFNRGPWNTVHQYHTAIRHREIAAVKQLPQLPRSPLTLCGPGTYIPTRERKLKALDCYLQLINYLIPSDPSINTSHLWHGDLHVANIFVNPSKPTEIVGFIDWQSTELAPLYHHARQPQIIDHDGPQVFSRERPKLPDDFKTLSTKDQKSAEKVFLQQSLSVLYNIITYRKNPPLYSALEFQQTLRHTLLLIPRNLSIDGEASYIGQVASLEEDEREEWENITGSKDTPYPFSFSPDERREMEAQAEGALRGMEAMQAVHDAIGNLFPEKGCVRTDLYEESLNALEQMKEQVIDEFAKSEEERAVWERMWPFGT